MKIMSPRSRNPATAARASPSSSSSNRRMAQRSHQQISCAAALLSSKTSQPSINFTPHEINLTSSSSSTLAGTRSTTMATTTTTTSTTTSITTRRPPQAAALFGSEASSISFKTLKSKQSRENNNNNNIIINKNRKSHCYSNNFAFLALVALSIMTILLFVCIDGVTSLECYSCSSYDNPDCDETFSLDANKTELLKVNCDTDSERPGLVCRKLVQYIEHKKVVIRECGYLNEHADKERKAMCLKRSGTFALMMESCICYGSLCNHSASLVPNQSVLMMLLLLASACTAMVANWRLSDGDTHKH